MDWIRIHGFELDCIFGIWPHERLREQRVRLELSLGVDTRRAARSGRVLHTVRYDVVANQLAAMLHFRRYLLIEVAAEELAGMLLAVHPAIEKVRLRLEKPKALEGKALAASVEIERVAADFPKTERPLGAASVSVWVTTRGAELSLQRLPEATYVALPVNTRRSLLLGVAGTLNSGKLQLEAGDSQVVEQPGAALWQAAGGPAEIFVCAEVPEPGDAEPADS
jgi:dihydroneopterin aldolase